MAKIDFSKHTHTDHFAQRASERFQVSKDSVTDWILENKDMVVDETASSSIIATNGDGLFFVSSPGDILKTCYSGVKQKRILEIKDELLTSVEKSILDAKIKITKEIISSSTDNINALNNINLHLSTMNSLFEIEMNNGAVFEEVLDLYNSSVNAVKNHAKRLKKENENLEEFLGRVKHQHNQITAALKRYKELKPSSELDCLSNKILFAHEKDLLDGFCDTTDVHLFSEPVNVTLDLLKEEVTEFSEASNLFPTQGVVQEAVTETNHKDDDGYLYEKEKLFPTTVAKGFDSAGDLKFSLLGGRMFTNLLNELVADKIDKKIREQISRKKCSDIKQFETFLAKKMTKKELSYSLYKNIMSHVFEAFAKTGFIERGYRFPDKTDIKKFETFVKEILKPYLKSKSLKKVQDLYTSMPFEGFIVNVLDIDGVGKGTKEKLNNFQSSLIDSKIEYDEFSYFIS